MPFTMLVFSYDNSNQISTFCFDFQCEQPRLIFLFPVLFIINFESYCLLVGKLIKYANYTNYLVLLHNQISIKVKRKMRSFLKESEKRILKLKAPK